MGHAGKGVSEKSENKRLKTFKMAKRNTNTVFKKG